MLRYRVLQGSFAICRLSAGAGLPTWALSGPIYFIARTSDELSIVCEESHVPADIQAETGWAALMLEGPFPFTMAGVLASFLQPLADSRIPIFAVSTFDTDYVLVKREHLERAHRALQNAGHELRD